MKKQISKIQARAFQKRWDSVNAEEIKQLRKTPIAHKLQQLNALWAWGKRLYGSKADTNGAEKVRERWVKLRRAYRG